jgi:hypothetical protein
MTDVEVLGMDNNEDNDNYPTVAAPPRMSSERGELSNEKAED